MPWAQRPGERFVRAGDRRAQEIGRHVGEQGAKGTTGILLARGHQPACDRVGRLERHGPLAEGALSRCIVTCPWHGWQFDVTTGVLVQDPTVGVTLHETRVLGDEVQVRLTAFAEAPAVKKPEPTR